MAAELARVGNLQIRVNRAQPRRIDGDLEKAETAFATAEAALKISGDTASNTIPLQIAGAVSLMINSHESEAGILAGTVVKSNNNVEVTATTRFVDKDVLGEEGFAKSLSKKLSLCIQLETCRKLASKA